MNRTVIILATRLALLVALPAAAQAKKKPVPRAVPVVVPLVLPPADSEQLAAAALTLFGDYACEFGKSLRVSRSPKFDGYVDLLFDKELFTLKPVLSHTGALRLEDVRGRLLLVQIPVKSMGMDVKIGRRLVDDCVHETQSENRRQLAAAPAGPGLGIDPDKAVADAAAPAASAAVAAPAVAPVQAAVVAPALSRAQRPQRRPPPRLHWARTPARAKALSREVYGYPTSTGPPSGALGTRDRPLRGDKRFRLTLDHPRGEASGHWLANT